jgi:glycosyltransferase involved in cell wall biosynthesis
VQGASLWNPAPPASGPRWAWFSRRLNPDTVTLLPFGDVPPLGRPRDAAQAEKYLVTAIVSTYKSAAFIRECLEDLVNQSICQSTCRSISQSISQSTSQSTSQSVSQSISQSVSQSISQSISGSMPHDTSGNASGRLEIIVVDAASPQDERSCVEEFQKSHGNITYIRTGQRIGIYAAWNIAARLASGKYLISVSTNDRLSRNACEILARALDENPDIALVYGDSVLTETPHQSFQEHTPSGRYQWPEYSFEDALKNCRVGPHPMWRRAVHDTLGYFDESFTAIGDQEMWLRIGEVFHNKILHVPEVTGLYWVTPDAVSQKGQAPHVEIYDIYRKYQKRYVLSIKQRVERDGFYKRPSIWSKMHGGRLMGMLSAAGIAASSWVFGGRPLLVWGAGEGGRVTLEMLVSAGVKAWGFIDSDKSRRGRSVSGITVHGPRLLGLLERLGCRPYVVIASMYAPEIRRILDARGYKNREDYWINIFELGQARNL